MASIELDKDVVIQACVNAIKGAREKNLKVYNSFIEDGLKKKTFWTRRPYTLEEAKSYATHEMISGHYNMMKDWTILDIETILNTAECSTGTIRLTDSEIGYIRKYLL